LTSKPNMNNLTKWGEGDNRYGFSGGCFFKTVVINAQPKQWWMKGHLSQNKVSMWFGGPNDTTDGYGNPMEDAIVWSFEGAYNGDSSKMVIRGANVSTEG
jgi:hypothetical protein